MTSVETITIPSDADTRLDESAVNNNYGSSTTIPIDNASSAQKRGLFRFPVPDFDGEITAAKLRLYVTAIVGAQQIGFYLVESPQDDLWVEGVAAGGADPEGATWNEYAKLFAWTTPGGDYAADPVAIYIWAGGNPVNQYYDIDIPLDNISLQGGKTYSLIAIAQTVGAAVTVQSKEAANDPELVLTIDVEEFDAPVVDVEIISSTELKVNWNKTELSDDNFKHYLVEHSDTGVGGWATLATVTDKNTVSVNHTGIVVQGDIDDYDEDSDTYPNGKTKYYRVTLVSNEFNDEKVSSVENNTTVPAVRPGYMTFFPDKSHYGDEPIIDNNQSYQPYGIRVKIEWYDSTDTTLLTQISQTKYEIDFYQSVQWDPTPPSATEYGDENDYGDEGYIIIGDEGFLPVRIQGEVTDIGGLIRKFTDDKVSQQQDVTPLPVPCPVAVPDGPFANAPPDMGGPFTGATPTLVDYSHCAQQKGEPLFEDDFQGTLTDRWDVVVANGATVSYVGGDRMRLYCPSAGLLKSAQVHKLLKGEGAVNKYNKHVSKYSSGYSLVYIFRPTGTATYQNSELYLWFKEWTAKGGRGTVGAGYYIRFIGNLNTVNFYRWNQAGTSQVLLASLNDGGLINPIDNVKLDKYCVVVISVSPIFDPVGSAEGDEILLYGKQFVTLADALAWADDPDFNSGEKLLEYKDKSHPGGDPKHYTGRFGLYFIQPFGFSYDLEIYEWDCIGKVGNVNLNEGQGYSGKNLTNVQTYPLQRSETPNFLIQCSPNLSSELCYFEGRIKNEYGAQSRTGEVDDYQGDTWNNGKPIASLLVQPTGYTNVSVQYNGSLSTDPEGGDLIYEWDPGDGSLAYQTTSYITNHVYVSAGLRTVKLRVQDESSQWSDWVEQDIYILDSDDLFIPITFIAGDPFTSIAPIAEDGDEETPMSGRAVSYYQLGFTGGRKWSLTGFTVQSACLDDATLIANAKAEIDELWTYYTNGVLVELTLPVIGTVRGYISNFRPKLDDINARLWTWTIRFNELEEEQLEA